MKIVTTQFDYSPIREIGVGQGRNSKVFLAHDPQTNGEIAVKEIPKADFRSVSEYFREAKSMRAADSPNVVPILIASAATDHVCLVMPYYKNGSLFDRIEHGPLALSEVIRVGQGILTGLSQIHIAKIIHFDIKPSNALFADNNDVMVADFGQSRPVDPTGVSVMPPMYTLAMPPEVIQTGVGAFSSDIYQAGLTLYRAVNGDPFFQSQLDGVADLRTAILDGRFPDRQSFMPHVPKWIRRVIRKSLKMDPAGRYGSAREFSDALGQHIDLDWHTTVALAEYKWRAERHQRTPVVVSLRLVGTHYDVAVYTENKPGCLRAKDKALLWKSGLSLRDAMTYLKTLFESMV